MKQTAINTEINQAYTQLKNLLTQNNCKILTQKPPTTLIAIHGSVWGTSPKTAQKKTIYNLQQNPNGTTITNTTNLASNYKKLTAIGCILSAALLIFCI